ncbi:MAG: peptide chain release factor 1 [Gammaproteobacteria bacterium]|nr:peptide chain release factor 1 [Gammaproteobacteria bacterium]MCY4218808.1 peptide chain release factor 1 [Gammaproteobacteria bacterium]MCY4274989.1 peptide chain release factor 1 [Gammaproteobacteria bacterium]
MKASTRQKLAQITDRYQELNALLADPDADFDGNRYRKYTVELSRITDIVVAFENYQELEDERAGLEELMDDSDPDIQKIVQEECSEIDRKLEHSLEAIQVLLIPQDPNDQRNLFLEIRAGTGGDEAALFSEDLFRMYYAYAESQKWTLEIISKSGGEHGGYKEIISRIVGQGAYAKLKFESGAHRVQRVPETESQGRIHTSACTVAVMPEAEEIDEIPINNDQLRIDKFRASGAGGQHVNKTDSAIRITHLPTGIVVECQDERSQHKNLARAMAVLRTRLLQDQIDKQQEEQASTRKSLVGSGDRSERIRTYNYPQGRVTDHRINLTLYKLDEILTGQLDMIIAPLIIEHRAEMLAMVNEPDTAIQ